MRLTNQRAGYTFIILFCLFVNCRITNAQNFFSSGTFSHSVQLAPHLGINSDSTSSVRPPALSAGKIAGQFFGGAILGGAGGIIAGFTASIISQCSGYYCEFEEFGWGAIVGYTVFSSIAVYRIGNTNNRTASLPIIFLADAAIFGGGIALTEELDGIGGLVLIFGMPIAGAILAYNITRKYIDKPDFPDLEINENVSLEMPTPKMLAISPFSKKQFAPAISLIILQF